MASLGGTFDSTTVEPSTGFELIPEGQYVAEIIKSENRKTKAGDGSYIALTWQICDGQLKGRQIWQNLNLDNPNQEAVNIAKAELSAICRAVDVPRPKDTDELHFRRARIKIVHKLNKQKGEQEARIGKIESLTAPPAAPTTGAAQTSPTGGSVPPWQRAAK